MLNFCNLVHWIPFVMKMFALCWWFWAAENMGEHWEAFFEIPRTFWIWQFLATACCMPGALRYPDIYIYNIYLYIYISPCTICWALPPPTNSSKTVFLSLLSKSSTRTPIAKPTFKYMFFLIQTLVSTNFMGEPFKPSRLSSLSIIPHVEMQSFPVALSYATSGLTVQSLQ